MVRSFTFFMFLSLSSCSTTNDFSNDPLFNTYVEAKEAAYQKSNETQLKRYFTERAINENKGEWPESWAYLVRELDKQMLKNLIRSEDNDCLVMAATNSIDDTTYVELYFVQNNIDFAIDGLYLKMTDKHDQLLFEIGSDHKGQYDCPELS